MLTIFPPSKNSKRQMLRDERIFQKTQIRFYVPIDRVLSHFKLEVFTSIYPINDLVSHDYQRR